MKAKITKNDGTVIEMEGTAEEIARIAADQLKPQILLQPQAPDPGRQTPIPHQPPYQPWITQPQIFWSDCCPMGGVHDYPQIWMSVGPASCSKCGKQSAPNTFTTTCGDSQANEWVANSTMPKLPFISAFTVVGESQS